jgi:hypothetical protein
MERFSDAALDKMKSLFIGKTGIFDHYPTSENQSARIYDTELVTDPTKTTKYGAPYKYLKGMAYMVRTDTNKDLIAEIDGGIKKEVSVGCSANKRICSICGCNKKRDSLRTRQGQGVFRQDVSCDTRRRHRRLRMELCCCSCTDKCRSYKEI